MPEELASTDFEKAFQAGGSLKSHEWLLMAGPVGKYALHGCVHGKEARLIFAYLEFLGALWGKAFRREYVETLISNGQRLLAQLELIFPAWELNINRHMMQHLVKAITEWGPPWTWSAFGYERLWGRMCDWLFNKARPEASIMLGMRALQTALQYLSKSQNYVSEHLPGKVSLFYSLISFDRATNKLVLPGFLKASYAQAVKVFDGGRNLFMVRPFSGHQVSKAFRGALQQLHLFYLRWPDRCRPCDCSAEECGCHDYRQLWDRYLVDQGILGSLSKERIAELLLEWPKWAEGAGISDAEQMLCYGPDARVQAYDRATLGPVQVSSSRQEQQTKAKNSIVAFETGDGGFHVGRVRRFLRHTPPGYDFSWEANVNEALIADVDWYATAVKGRPANAALDSAGLDKYTGLPVVKRSHVDDRDGNYWRCDLLVQSKFGLAQHPLRQGDMFLLTRSTDHEVRRNAFVAQDVVD